MSSDNGKVITSSPYESVQERTERLYLLLFSPSEDVFKEVRIPVPQPVQNYNRTQIKAIINRYCENPLRYTQEITLGSDVEEKRSEETSSDEMGEDALSEGRIPALWESL